jgi:hypothetical protein
MAAGGHEGGCSPPTGALIPLPTPHWKELLAMPSVPSAEPAAANGTPWARSAAIARPKGKTGVLGRVEHSMRSSHGSKIGRNVWRSRRMISSCRSSMREMSRPGPSRGPHDRGTRAPRPSLDDTMIRFKGFRYHRSFFLPREDRRRTTPPPGEPRPVASRMTPTPDRCRRPSSPPGPVRSATAAPARRQGSFPPNRLGPLHPTRHAFGLASKPGRGPQPSPRRPAARRARGRRGRRRGPRGGSPPAGRRARA